MLVFVLVRFLSLFTLMAVQIASDKPPEGSLLSHLNQKSRQNWIKFRHRGDKIALKSQLVYTRDIEVATSARQKLH